jgi:hypothetical protein
VHRFHLFVVGESQSIASALGAVLGESQSIGSILGPQDISSISFAKPSHPYFKRAFSLSLSSSGAVFKPSQLPDKVIAHSHEEELLREYETLIRLIGRY